MLNNKLFTYLKPSTSTGSHNSASHRGLNTEHLDITNQVIMNALHECDEISAVLVDLKRPNWIDVHDDKLMMNFLFTFQSMVDGELVNINSNSHRFSGNGNVELVYKPKFLWSIKNSIEEDALYYSLMIIFDKEAFPFANQQEIWRMFFGIESAWAIALGFNVDGGIGGNPLVQKFEQFEYKINKTAAYPCYKEHEFNRLLFDASHLFQLKNQNYGDAIQLYSSGIDDRNEANQTTSMIIGE